MRPIRVTGVTGNSNWVPLDIYSNAGASVQLIGGTGAVQYTLDDPFSAAAPTGVALTLASGFAAVPPGARAVRGTGLGPTDVLNISQQGGFS
jgi:hypothetical protein